LCKRTSYTEMFDDQTYHPKYALCLIFYRKIYFDTTILVSYLSCVNITIKPDTSQAFF